MAEFVNGQEVQTSNPTVEVTVNPAAPLSPGRHGFQLIVVDDAGNQSEPDVVGVIVLDAIKPTAVLGAPRAVPIGSSFKLIGTRSADVPPGKIVSYRWKLLS